MKLVHLRVFPPSRKTGAGRLDAMAKSRLTA
jgi:hypothetical protein